MIKRYTPDVPFSPEIHARIALNAQRLREPYYQIDQVFSPLGYDWPGDKEGRALLAFVSHYKATGDVNPCMPAMLEQLPARVNEKGYLGHAMEDVISEQQLSGHSWLLRGLCEHYEQFLDDVSLAAVKTVVEGLFLPIAGKFASYPTTRDGEGDGGVSGHGGAVVGCWNLSSDTGTAFMAFDGLSHAYKVTRDERIHALLDEMLDTYTAMDKYALKAHTHCSLTAARGIVRMYNCTEDPRYLVAAKDIWDLFVFGHGMTPTFQNINWWQRPDTWTEPCGIVDAIILSCELYKITRQDKYRRLAARVFHNGLASAQRPNGGAGTDKVVFPGDPDLPNIPANEELYMDMYEAPFCCTMRLAEGLWYVNAHADLLYYELERRENGRLLVLRDVLGRYMCGDRVLAEIVIPEGADLEGWTPPEPIIEVEGHRLTFLLKYYELPDAVARVIRQRVLFGGGQRPW